MRNKKDMKFAVIEERGNTLQVIERNLSYEDACLKQDALLDEYLEREFIIQPYICHTCESTGFINVKTENGNLTNIKDYCPNCNFAGTGKHYLD